MNPTKYPYGNNRVPSTGVLFEDRKLYKEYFIKAIEETQEKFKIPFADLYLDNSLFGLIDLDADLIQLKDPEATLVTVAGFNNEQFKLLNFVADAYADLKTYFYRAMTSGKIPVNNFMTELQIYRAYINPESVDKVYKNILKSDFKSLYLQNHELNSSIKNYKDFSEQFNNYLINNIDRYPITQGTSLLSSNFLGFSSGMAFDIANLRTDDDLQKYLQFLSSEQFKFFADGCLRYGFKIDKNVPWRLVADINSISLAVYYQRYGIKNINDIFKNYFVKTYTMEIDNLKRFYLDSYNYFITDNESYYESYSKLCDKNSYPKVLKREKMNEDRFYKEYHNSHWIRVYTYYKNLEFKKGLTQIQFDNIVREAADYARIGKLDRSLRYLNGYFKDYSLVLYYKQKQTVAEETLDDVTNESVNKLKL